MKSSPLIESHLLFCLNEYLKRKTPLDLFVHQHFKKNKNLGPKERKIIGDTLFGLIRWKSLVDFLSPKDDVRKKLSTYQSLDFEKMRKDPTIPRFAKLGTSPFLYEIWTSSFGFDLGEKICQICNEEAPIAIRANPLKISREELYRKLSSHFPLHFCKEAPHGLQLDRREALLALPEFREGLFEIQDEGSQLVSDLVDPKEGDLVVDLCAGSGGKTLAFAHKMKGRGQIFLTDVRERALQEAKKRLRKAGIQNGQCLPKDHPQMGWLQNKCDWVLVDAPCSGTGTLRRNVDQKWRIDAASIAKCKKSQRELLEEALSLLKPGGTLVYATCSILKEENEMQISSLNPGQIEPIRKPLFFLPESGGKDGFFAFVGKKKSI